MKPFLFLGFRKTAGVIVLFGILQSCCMANGQKKADVKKQIFQLVMAARLFSTDGGGTFPKSLDEIKFIDIPKYRCPDGSEKDFVYVPGFDVTDSDEFALVASPSAKGATRRWVGTISGKVMELRPSAVEKMLSESKQHLKKRHGK